MELTAKYLFRPYDQEFPILFEKEKERLLKVLGRDIQLEHIGSTAIPGMPGKGVIDICVSLPRDKWNQTKTILSGLGYDYKPKEKERETERLFFMANLPDRQLGTRIYHIHLTHSGSSYLKESLAFCDYLRSHPSDAKKYAEIKKNATLEAQKHKTKDEMRDTYMKVKAPVIEKILSKLGFKKLPD